MQKICTSRCWTLALLQFARKKSDLCRCDRYYRWKVVSLGSLNFFFSAIAPIVAIIWKPGLSYASSLNKIRFNNYT